MAPKLVFGQFLWDRVPNIKESLYVFQEKFFVAKHFRNSIANNNINSNRLRQICRVT